MSLELGKRVSRDDVIKEIWKKYGKNRYTKNPDSKPLHVVYHILN